MNHRHALTVLTRLADSSRSGKQQLTRVLGPRLNALAGDALDVSIETGDPIGPVLDKLLKAQPSFELASRLVRRLPKETIAARELAVTVTEQALSALDASPSPETTAREGRRTGLMLDLAGRLGAIGDGKRALQVAEEVVSRLDHLRQSDDSLLEFEGRAYSTLSTCLSDVGRHEESLSAIEHSVEIQRRRPGAGGNEPRWELAASLGLLSVSLSGLGRRGDALEPCLEATRILDRLVGEDAPQFQPMLADALNKLGTLQIHMGKFAAGIASARRSLELYRSLAAQDADAYLFHVAVGLNNLANNVSLAERGRGGARIGTRGS